MLRLGLESGDLDPEVEAAMEAHAQAGGHGAGRAW
jgi:hypothetical protein